MKASIRLANLELHAWSGMLLSFILYVVFVCGSFALFKDQTVRWNQPELRGVIENKISLDQLMVILANEKPTTDNLSIRLPNANVPYYAVYRKDSENDEGSSSYYNLAGEKIAAMNNAIALDLVDELHRDLLIPNGDYIVGLASVLMLFALLSGLIYHWKHLARDVFKLRGINIQGRTNGQIKVARRTFWLDLHNLTGVIGLPFHLMYAFTGAFFSLVLIYQVSVGIVVFKGDTTALLEAAGRITNHVETSPKEAGQEAVVPQGIDNLYQEVLNTSDDNHIRRIIIDAFGDQNQQVKFETMKLPGLSSWGHSRYRLSTGELIEQKNSTENSVLIKTIAIISKLHMASFVNMNVGIIPWLYFFLGLSGAIMMLSGNLLWLQKKKKSQRGSSLFNRCFGRLNVAICLGLWTAMAMLALSAHTLPWSLENRGQWQETIFFTSWAAACFYALLTQAPLLTAAGRMALVTAIIITLTPISHSLATGDGLFAIFKLLDQQVIDSDQLISNQKVLIGIDACLMVFAMMFFIISHKLTRREDN